MRCPGSGKQCKILKGWKGSYRICRNASLWGFASVCLALSLRIVDMSANSILKDGILADQDFIEFSFQALSGVAGFLVVFQSSQAYSRFWNGSQIIHSMMGYWHDATSCCLAFCRYSNAPADQIREFQHMFVRLMSLLNAMILGDLEGLEITEELMAHMNGTKELRLLSTSEHARGLDFEVLDISVISAQDLNTVYSASNKVEIVYHWIEALIVEQVKTGVLSIPPPLLTRVFQELGRGMVLYHEGMQLVKVATPHPYTATTQLMLVILSIMAPFTACSNSETLGWPLVFTFLLVFVLWSLHFTAAELENPFGDDANDLDLRTAQEELNSRLIDLMQPKLHKLPKTTVSLSQLEERLSCRKSKRHASLFQSVRNSIAPGTLAYTSSSVSQVESVLNSNYSDADSQSEIERAPQVDFSDSVGSVARSPPTHLRSDSGVDKKTNSEAKVRFRDRPSFLSDLRNTVPSDYAERDCPPDTLLCSTGQDAEISVGAASAI